MVLITINWHSWLIGDSVNSWVRERQQEALPQWEPFQNHSVIHNEWHTYEAKDENPCCICEETVLCNLTNLIIMSQNIPQDIFPHIKYSLYSLPLAPTIQQPGAGWLLPISAEDPRGGFRAGLCSSGLLNANWRWKRMGSEGASGYVVTAAAVYQRRIKETGSKRAQSLHNTT